MDSHSHTPSNLSGYTPIRKLDIRNNDARTHLTSDTILDIIVQSSEHVELEHFNP